MTLDTFLVFILLVAVCDGDSKTDGATLRRVFMNTLKWVEV
jgi:hypothetical protein